MSKKSLNETEICDQYITPEKHGTQHLRFSVLLTMDLRSTGDEVIARESFFKEALGTRVFGLNSN
jgi:hypothetical protein